MGPVGDRRRMMLIEFILSDKESRDLLEPLLPPESGGEGEPSGEKGPEGNNR